MDGDRGVQQWVRRHPSRLRPCDVVIAPVAVRAPAPSERHPAKPFKHAHPHHHPRPLSYCLLRARVCSARQSWFLVRVHYPQHTPEHPHLAGGIARVPHAILDIHPHMGQSHWHSKLCWPTPVVTASLQYRPDGMARAGKLSCRAVGTAGSVQRDRDHPDTCALDSATVNLTQKAHVSFGFSVPTRSAVRAPVHNQKVDFTLNCIQSQIQISPC